MLNYRSYIYKHINTATKLQVLQISFALMPILLGLIGQTALQVFQLQMHLLWTLFLSSSILVCLRTWPLFFFVLWSIQGNRNQAIFGDSALPPAIVWDTTKRAHLDYVDARLSFPPAPPPVDFFKINVDGATDVGGGNFCIGAVIRDSSGFPIGALSLALPSCFPAEITEAYALLHGVLFASEMQVHQALFESDALSIIHDLTFEVPGSDFGHILEDIRVASSSFSFYSFHHLKRDGNRAAHSLALEAKSSGQSKIWKGIPPPCIQDILSEDLLYQQASCLVCTSFIGMKSFQISHKKEKKRRYHFLNLCYTC